MKISILVPIYNAEKYIERCARSLFIQTYENIEYVFIDDGSTDESINILLRCANDYQNRKEKIKIIHHTVNRGLSASRNTAIRNCSGDFIMHVDADDYIEPNTLDVLAQVQREQNADIVSGNGEMIGHDHTYDIGRKHYGNVNSMICDMLSPTISHTLWGRLIKTSLYKDNNIKCEEGVNIGEDWQVMPKLVYYAKRIAFVDKILYHYDCRNNDSYMNSSKYDNSKYHFRLEQEIKSNDILADFFKDKTSIYIAIIEENKKRLMIRKSILYCMDGNKNEFDKLRHTIKNYDRCIAKKEGKLIELCYYFKFHYIPCRLLCILRKCLL